ncbi:hypothetical protein OE88DRAFT_1644929 [Heliocybe sulcata]|uniref:Ubiquitin-like protease family profile domain-containing protein n=1 Tax=Heliocybe sulcata TaxID=5364 RepID=A0A5C3N4U8_9AGAM|nr:hypothetical protein OE88DRAFT_1644929 [Heliocybe sulcata]
MGGEGDDGNDRRDIEWDGRSRMTRWPRLLGTDRSGRRGLRVVVAESKNSSRDQNRPSRELAARVNSRGHQYSRRSPSKELSAASERTIELQRHRDHKTTLKRIFGAQNPDRPYHRGVQRQSEEAKKDLDKCGIAIPELRRQWELQRAAQTSIRAHAPARLKKELDVVLALQAEIDDLEKALSKAYVNLEKAAAPTMSLTILQKLKSTHAKLVLHAEALYTSLNIPNSFPHLKGVDYEFVRLLILTCDLKMNIRKWAIASFLEWDRLDQAVGGRDNPLGTKLHQRTRKTMAKRRPALQVAICKFNKYCDTLQQLHHPQWGVPAPLKLSTDLSMLRDDPALLQDVWIEPFTTEPPRWLYDSDVWVGICAMLKVDRCLEECRRLGIEADNICRWFGRELTTLELALRLPENAAYATELEHHLQDVRLLRQHWENPLMSAIVFNYHLASSIDVALCLSGEPTATNYHWLPPLIQFSEAELAEMEAVVDHDDADVPDVPASVAEDLSHVLLTDILAESVDDGGDEELLDGLDVEGGDHGKVHMIWQHPDNMRFDQWLNTFKPLYASDHMDRGRFRPPLGPFQCLDFSPKDIARIHNSRSPLNDECVNGCAALLFTDLVPRNDLQHIVVFSTLLMTWIQDKVSDERLWWNVRHYQYWERGIWVIPIFRPNLQGGIGHWTLAIVNHVFHYIFHFDSLASEDVWHDDTKIATAPLGCSIHESTDRWMDKSPNLVHTITAQQLRLRTVDARMHGSGVPRLQRNWDARASSVQIAAVLTVPNYAASASMID